MPLYALRDGVTAMRWTRDPGRDPWHDNAEEVMDFIGRDRIVGTYEARFGDEAMMFTSNVSSNGLCHLKSMDWVMIGPEGEPMVIAHSAFMFLTGEPVQD